MTVERMIELLEIEKECVLRNAIGECNRYCAGCDLLQDDTELHEMYTEALALLKAQDAQLVIVSRDYIEGTVFRCPKCKEVVHKYNGNYCPHCGQAVKWE